MSWFALATLLGWTAVVLTAALVRSRLYATFVGVLLGLHSLVAIALAASFSRVFPAFVYFHAAVYLHFVMLARPRMRSLSYRALVSWPAAFFSAGTLFALPWGIAAALGFHPWAPWFPYVLAMFGMVQSLTSREEVLDVTIGGEHVDGLRPFATGVSERRFESTTSASSARPLHIVQITDPHLGPFMSVSRLRRICARAVARKPDLVMLTGDFLTMESQSDGALLTEALAPLRAMEGRVFACHGNHDHEAPLVVANALSANGVRLLVDDAAEVQTEAGLVQIVGMDFAFRNREERLAAACARHPRKAGALRIVLLHDPGAFRHLPEGQGDLVLSGHTHGGQVGLLSLGFRWTFLRLFGNALPDHGFWARGLDRLYVHRGTGHYGFPLRLGVPAEESLLRVHRA